MYFRIFSQSSSSLPSQKYCFQMYFPGFPHPHLFPEMMYAYIFHDFLFPTFSQKYCIFVFFVCMCVCVSLCICVDFPSWTSGRSHQPRRRRHLWLPWPRQRPRPLRQGTPGTRPGTRRIRPMIRMIHRQRDSARSRAGRRGGGRASAAPTRREM